VKKLAGKKCLFPEVFLFLQKIGTGELDTPVYM
jgi:hypothetical protein